tara:strand:+ start:75 stop:200 length:126 start_codon:yes stop_codon:yes gene_type:complete
MESRIFGMILLKINENLNQIISIIDENLFENKLKPTIIRIE